MCVIMGRSFGPVSRAQFGFSVCLNLVSELRTGLDMSHEGLHMSLPTKCITLLIHLAGKNISTKDIVVPSSGFWINWRNVSMWGWKLGTQLGNFWMTYCEHAGWELRSECEPQTSWDWLWKSSAGLFPRIWLCRLHENLQHRHIYHLAKTYQVHVTGPSRGFKKHDPIYSWKRNLLCPFCRAGNRLWEAR